MPILTTLGAAAARAYGFSLGSNYFMSLLSSTLSLSPSSLDINATNKRVQIPTQADGYPILTLNPNGVLSSTSVSGYTGLYLYTSTKGSNGYTYISAYDSINLNPYLITLDSTGAFYSLLKLPAFNTTAYYAVNIVANNSGDVFILLESDQSATYSCTLVKINPISAPTTLYEYVLPTFNDSFGAQNSTINSSGKVVFGNTVQNYFVSPNDAQTAYVQIVDPVSGGTSTQVVIGGSIVGYFPQMHSTVVDSSDNIYFCANIKYGSVLKKILCKANSTLTSISWTLDLSATSSPVSGGQLVVDTSNNIYLLSGASGVIYLTKVNSSGVVQYSRQITTSSSGGFYTPYNAIRVIDSDLYITGNTSTSPAKTMLLKVPTDGSRTATFSLGGYTMSYADSSQTITTTTAPSLTSTTVTTATTARTSTTPSYTNTSYTASSAVHGL